MAWNQWSTIRAQLRTFLGDTSGNKWAASELRDYANWALDDLVRFRARRRSIDYLATELEVDFPADFYKPLVVQFPDGEFVEEIKLEPGVFWYSETTIDTGSVPSGWYRDDDKIYLLRDPDGAWTLHYYAYYPGLETDNSIMAAPRWFVQALIYYAAACATLKDAMGEAQINRWNLKRDSGRPVDNPLLAVVDKLHNKYLEIVLQHADDEEEMIPIWRPRQRSR